LELKIAAPDHGQDGGDIRRWRFLEFQFIGSLPEPVGSPFWFTGVLP
jgi:hypothetical protein